MKKRYMTMLLIIFVIFAAGCGKSLDPLAWKAEKDGKTVYLFGSIHVADKSFYPLPDGIEEAYASSKALAVEVDTRNVDQAAMTKFVLEKGMYPPGESLKDALGDDFPAFKQYCDDNDLPWTQLNSMRPWFVSTSLTQIAMQKLNLDPTKGLDLHFMNSDPEKPIKQLESLEDQLKYLSGFSDEIQIMWLMETVEDESNSEDNLKELVEIWKAGDENALKELLFKDRMEKPMFEPFYELMFDVRNGIMVKGIGRILKEDNINTLFVVVGAGHLVGEKGVPSRLAAMGYTVTRI